MGGITEIWGHRGASAYAPENTLAAFKMAIDMGADGVELDIQLTKDNEVVVIHNESIDRICGRKGNVRDYSFAELKEFMDIPTLAEVFELISPTSLKINVEFKTGLVWYEGIENKAISLARQFNMMSRIIWSSFNHYSVQIIKEIEPSAKTALLCGGGIFITAKQCKLSGADALHCDVHQMRYPGIIQDCHNHDIDIRAWTVDNDDDLKFAYESGIDAVITNVIDKAKDARHVGARFIAPYFNHSRAGEDARAPMSGIV